MKLIELTLENFQGIRGLTLSFGGKSASIYGDNATGKTTVFNAITWLLFDKPGNGAKNFTPKTKGADGDLHNLEHSAEATFLDGGRMITLKKVYHEVYKKQRGSAHEEFSGHTVDYYLDGVPVKEKEYAAAVLAMTGGDSEKPKMLTMPDYFSEGMPWEARRRILLELLGDVSDADVIAGSPELCELPKLLLMPGSCDRTYTVEEYRKIATAKKGEINRRLLSLPGRIDEAARAIPETEGISRETIERTLANLATERDRALGERENAMRGDTGAAEIRKRMAEVECTLAERRSQYVVEQGKQNAALDTEIRAVRDELTALERDSAEVTCDLGFARKKVARLKTEREQLLAEYDKVAAEVFGEEAAICPTCHRPLPEEDVDEMREQFNLRKSRRLEEINERGRTMASRRMIDDAESAIAELDEALKAIPERRREILAKLDALEARRMPTVRFEETNGYYAYQLELEGLRAKLSDAEKGRAEALGGVDGKLRAIDVEIRAQNEMLARFAVAESQRTRIAELEAEEKRLAAEFEDLERGLYLCDLFTRAKVSALTERINGAFTSVRFRLFREQINGGVAEDCEVMIPTADGRMVPYSFANSAARINAGLEIISVLSRHFGVEMPIVVDNAESVTHLAAVDTQVIRLVVSEADKHLRLELNEKENYHV